MNQFIRPVTGRLFYILAITAFFVTFFNLRCGKVRMARISGFNMAVGGKVRMAPDMQKWMDDDTRQDTVSREEFQRTFFGRASAIHVPVNYWALAAITLCILAFMAALMHSLSGYRVQTILTGLSILSLLGMIFTRPQYVLKIMKLDLPPVFKPADIFDQQVMLSLGLGWGLWVALAALMAALLTGIVLHDRLKTELETEAVLEQFNPGQEKEAGIYPADQ